MKVKKQKEITLHGRGIVPGVAEGEALVTKQKVSGWGGINPANGIIIDRGHEIEGQSIKGKIFVFPFSKGSSGWGPTFYATFRAGNGPLAVINQKADTLVANGVIRSSIPTVVDLDRDPCRIIETGDFVRVDANRGIVIVFKNPMSA